MVAVGRVRVEDKAGNDFADRAADFGRRRVSDLVMDLRRRFVSACSFWYPVVLDLHRFFVAIARAAVNEDECAGVALHPTVWFSGGLVKRRRVRVSAWDLLGFLVLLVFGDKVPWVGLVLRLVVLMLVIGRILLGSWLSFVLF